MVVALTGPASADIAATANDSHSVNVNGVVGAAKNSAVGQRVDHRRLGLSAEIGRNRRPSECGYRRRSRGDPHRLALAAMGDTVLRELEKAA